MKTNIRLFAACAVIAAGGAMASAQNTNSGYFLDGYNYRYQMNPAFGNDMNFVSFPVLGNINAAMRGNIHMTYIYHVVYGQARTLEPFLRHTQSQRLGNGLR